MIVIARFTSLFQQCWRCFDQRSTAAGPRRLAAAPQPLTFLIATMIVRVIAARFTPSATVFSLHERSAAATAACRILPTALDMMRKALTWSSSSRASPCASSAQRRSARESDWRATDRFVVEVLSANVGAWGRGGKAYDCLHLFCTVVRITGGAVATLTTHLVGARTYPVYNAQESFGHQRHARRASFRLGLLAHAKQQHLWTFG